MSYDPFARVPVSEQELIFSRNSQTPLDSAEIRAKAFGFKNARVDGDDWAYIECSGNDSILDNLSFYSEI